MNAADVKRAAALIDNSNLAPFLNQAIENAAVKSGRPRELPVRTLLIALAHLSTTGTMHLSRIPAMLNGLDPQSKINLGITRANGVTRRQVENLYNLICEVLEDADLARFDEFCDKLTEASLPPEVSASKSIAIDSTDIDSWGRDRRPRPNRARRNTDPDARWRRKSKDNPWKRAVFGYELTTAVVVPEINGPSVPLAARRIRFRAAGVRTVEMGVQVARGCHAAQGGLNDVIADRLYSASNTGMEFALPMRALGASPVIAMQQRQLGVLNTVHGALIIDGQPFSPATPLALRVITPPAVGAPAADYIAYQQQIALRSIYAMVPHGAPRADGSQVFKCPAAAGKILCPLQASPANSAPGLMPALSAPASVAPNSVCSRKYTTFQAVDIPLAQRDLHGSHKWFVSWSRRSLVEGFYGNLKNEACENLNRGTIRVRGLVKTGLLVAFAVASANIRLHTAFLNRTPLTKKGTARKKIGRPRNNSLIQSITVNLDVAANAPPVTTR